MDKEELKKQLEEIDKQIDEESIKIKKSKEYRDLENAISSLWDKKNKIGKKLTDIRKKEFRKYAKFFWETGYGVTFNPKDVKPNIKQGIKRGLGITNVLLIRDYQINEIVDELVKIGLGGTEEEHLKEKSVIEKKIREKSSELDKLRTAIPLLKKRRELDEQLNKEKSEKEEKWNKRTKEVRIKIEEHLPEYIDKIKKEVDKELMLEKLE